MNSLESESGRSVFRIDGSLNTDQYLGLNQCQKLTHNGKMLCVFFSKQSQPNDSKYGSSSVK